MPHGWNMLGTVVSWKAFAAAKWCNKHPWVVVEEDGVYCLYSKLGTGLLSGFSVFVSLPFTGPWLNILVQHKHSESHQATVERDSKGLHWELPFHKCSRRLTCLLYIDEAFWMHSEWCIFSTARDSPHYFEGGKRFLWATWDWHTQEATRGQKPQLWVWNDLECDGDSHWPLFRVGNSFGSQSLSMRLLTSHWTSRLDLAFSTLLREALRTKVCNIKLLEGKSRSAEVVTEAILHYLTSTAQFTSI